MAGLSFDAGVLIALDRNDETAWAWFKRAVDRGEPPTVSTVAIAEAWRSSRQAQLPKVLRACDVVDLDQRTARAAGEALAAVRGASTTDAIIAASASLAGTRLLTTDLHDMQALADQHFRTLRVAYLDRG